MSNTIFNNITLTKKIKLENKIIMYSGNTLPDGYFWCDGSNGTPDLRSRFIYGIVENFSPGIIGDSKINYIPSHNHNITTINQVTNHNKSKNIQYRLINTVVNHVSNTNENRRNDDDTTARIHDHNVNNTSSGGAPQLSNAVQINFNSSTVKNITNNNIQNTGVNNNEFIQKYIYIGFIMKV